MRTLVLLAAISQIHAGKNQGRCPATEVVVLTPEPWTEFDSINLDMAKKRCGVKFKKSPCLKKVIRWGEARYSAICGKKK